MSDFLSIHIEIILKLQLIRNHIKSNHAINLYSITNSSIFLFEDVKGIKCKEVYTLLEFGNLHCIF